MKKHIIIDIETLPCANEAHTKYLVESVQADSRLKDPEKISADISAKQSEVVSKTGLDGDFGRILCASIADVDGGNIITYSSATVDEKTVLNQLINGIAEMAQGDSFTASSPVIVGHNIGWDLRFIAKRCVINGVKINRMFLPFDAKPWELCDTMTIWSGSQNRITLDRLCVALGVESPKSEMDGSMVAQYFSEGRLDDIIKYNREDVRATRECFNIMRQYGMVG